MSNIKVCLLKGKPFFIFLPQTTILNMKKLYALAAMLFVLVSCTSNSNEIETAKTFQNKLNKEFANSETSPLPKDALKTFKGLDFFPIQEDFIISGKLERTPNEEPFEMNTTTSRKPVYVKYGVASFEYNNKTYKVDIFQDVNLRKKKEYEKHLFLPFTDLTSGDTTYGGGRYLDLEIPEGEDIILNFNMAYNPYCVYNPKFSCPIPPEQNFLEFEINAGVKDYKYE